MIEWDELRSATDCRLPVDPGPTGLLPNASLLEMAQMFRVRGRPLLGWEGQRAEERGERGGTKERERSELRSISA